MPAGPVGQVAGWLPCGWRFAKRPRIGSDKTCGNRARHKGHPRCANAVLRIRRAPGKVSKHAGDAASRLRRRFEYDLTLADPRGKPLGGELQPRLTSSIDQRVALIEH